MSKPNGPSREEWEEMKDQLEDNEREAAYRSLMHRFTQKKPLMVDGVVYAYSVWLKVDQQSFQIGSSLYEQDREADWLRRQLAIALYNFKNQ
jgi:hypothetical protein